MNETTYPPAETLVLYYYDILFVTKGATLTQQNSFDVSFKLDNVQEVPHLSDCTSHGGRQLGVGVRSSRRPTRIAQWTTMPRLTYKSVEVLYYKKNRDLSSQTSK